MLNKITDRDPGKLLACVIGAIVLLIFLINWPENDIDGKKYHELLVECLMYAETDHAITTCEEASRLAARIN